jgi:hypothetical protein
MIFKASLIANGDISEVESPVFHAQRLPSIPDDAKLHSPGHFFWFRSAIQAFTAFALSCAARNTAGRQPNRPEKRHHGNNLRCLSSSSKPLKKSAPSPSAPRGL